MPDMVRVRHPELDAVVVVPRRSLRQMAPGWAIVSDEPAGEEPERTAEAVEAPRRTRKKEEG